MSGGIIRLSGRDGNAFFLVFLGFFRVRCSISGEGDKQTRHPAWQQKGHPAEYRMALDNLFGEAD